MRTHPTRCRSGRGVHGELGGRTHSWRSRLRLFYKAAHGAFPTRDDLVALSEEGGSGTRENVRWRIAHKIRETRTALNYAYFAEYAWAIAVLMETCRTPGLTAWMDETTVGVTPSPSSFPDVVHGREKMGIIWTSASASVGTCAVEAASRSRTGAGLRAVAELKRGTSEIPSSSDALRRLPGPPSAAGGRPGVEVR